MRNKDIFTEVYKPHETRQVKGFDSLINSGSTSIGHINGQYRKINAIVTDDHTENDLWRVVNVTGSSNGVAHYDSIAVLGAIDDQTAIDLAMLQFGRMFDAQATDVTEISAHGLNHVLNTKKYSMTRQVFDWQLKECQNLLVTEKPDWDDSRLKNFGGQNSNLLLDLVKHDVNHDLLNRFDSMASLLSHLGNVEVADYDAIVIDYQHLDRFMSLLHVAMNNAQGSLKINSVDISKPFKRNNVVQIAVIYNFDDGQTLSILFNNPDSTPNKILPSDTVVSWKYLLNKRDVTGAVQPNQGEGISLPILAQRLMKIANANSVRFARTQAKRIADAEKLDETIKRVAEKQTQLDDLINQVDDLKSQLDTIMTGANNNKSTMLSDDDPNNPSPAKTEEQLAEEQRILDEEKAAAEAKVIEEANAAAEAKRKADEEEQQRLADEIEAQQKADAEAKAEQAKADLEAANALNNLNPDDLAKAQEEANKEAQNTDPDQAEAAAKAESERLEQERLAKEADDKAQAERDLLEAKKQEEANANDLTDQGNDPSYTDSDIDFLTKIVDGQIDAATVDMDEFIRIGEINDEDPLFVNALAEIEKALNEQTQ